MQAAGEPPLTDAPAERPVGEVADPAALPPRRRRAGLLVAAATGVFAADLATKTWVVHHLVGGRVIRLLGGALLLVQSRNAGAAFSIATGATVIFSVVAIAVAAFIVRTLPTLRSVPWAIALGLLLGGALGNLGDRLFRSPGVFRGRVVDWIDFRVWPVFNLADAGIVVGGALAVVLAARGLRPDGSRETRS